MPIVLVHGAWSGGWSFLECARILRKRGYDVFNPTLTGLAEHNHIAPEHVSLESHIRDIAGLMEFNDLRDVLIVGHSYGGMVITGAADRQIERIAGMVYLDAFLPQTNQSLWDLAGQEAAEAQWKAAQQNDGGKSVPRPFIPTQNAPEAEKWKKMFTPHPVGCMSEKFVSVREPEQRTWPRRHYILCNEYKGSVFHMFAAQVQGESGWEYSEFDALHDVVRSHPQMTADRIDAIAKGWGIKA